MCDAVVLAGNWKPNIVQLVPFSHTKEKETPESIQSPRTEELRRSYPILAVTRCTSGRSEHSHVTHVIPSERDEIKREDFQVPYSGRKPTDFIRTGWVKSTYQENRMKQEKDADLRCSVQNLNEQALLNADDTMSAKPQKTLSDSGSQSDVSERKSFQDQNGPKRAVKLTPGEIDLQRFRECYAKEQAQRRKKYKLNVNQLPRSTTPINDHDPDKLNMKQVINFLQKKTGTETQPKYKMRQSAVKVQLHDRKEMLSRERPATETRVSSQTHLSSGVFRDRPATDVPRATDEEFAKSKTSENSQNGEHKKRRSASRDSCPSVLSTRSVPIIDKRDVNDYTEKSSSRSVVEKIHKNRANKHQTKEFKLYRFLALAPNGHGQTTIPHAHSKPRITEATVDRRKDAPKVNKQENGGPQVAYRSTALREIPLIQRSEGGAQTCECVTGSKFTATQERISERKKFNRTANLVHRRALKKMEQKRKENPIQTEEIDYYRKPGPIRLPSVHDYEDDVKHYESEAETEDEDEVAEIRSVFSHRVSPEHDSSSDHASDVAITSRSDITNDRLSTLHSNLVFQRLYGNSAANKARKISINVPGEEETNSANDVIKLTLRQEKFVTPRRSYMHDIATPKYAQNQYSVRYLDEMNSQTTDAHFNDNGFRIDVSIHPKKEFQDSFQEQLMFSGSETLANSCIKVRQKLKATNFETSA